MYRRNTECSGMRSGFEQIKEPHHLAEEGWKNDRNNTCSNKYSRLLTIADDVTRYVPTTCKPTDGGGPR